MVAPIHPLAIERKWDANSLRSIRWNVSSNSIQEVFENECLCEATYYSLHEVLITTNIASPKDGLFVPNIWDMPGTETNVLGYVFDNLDDFLDYFYTNDPIVEVDSYSGRKNIRNQYKYQAINYLPEIFYFDIGPENNTNTAFSIVFHDDCAWIRFTTRNRVFKGDCFSLLFDSGDIIDLPILNRPIRTNNTYEIDFLIHKEDLRLLQNHRLKSYRITFQKEAKHPFTSNIENPFFRQYTHQSIIAYVNSFLDSLYTLVPQYQFPNRLIKKEANKYTFNWCYVYLMKDISNGYHKIGISNTPEYRERTLQSEKPTIEMLACKKFPTRKIAESIESALHTAYSQQRLRGEWFNLNDADVAAIIEMLM